MGTGSRQSDAVGIIVAARAKLPFGISPRATSCRSALPQRTNKIVHYQISIILRELP